MTVPNLVPNFAWPGNPRGFPVITGHLPSFHARRAGLYMCQHRFVSPHKRIVQEVAVAQGQRERQEKQVVCVCCVCGEARDDIAADGAWHSLQAHLSKHGIQEQDLMFTHTYCPWCLDHYKELLGLLPKQAARGLGNCPGKPNQALQTHPPGANPTRAPYARKGYSP